MKINGITTILNHDLPNIEGGFGEGKRGILVKSVAELHKRSQSNVNREISRHEKRFKIDVDLIDIKLLISIGMPNWHRQLKQQLIDSGILTQEAIDASKNIWVLSERGYAKLTKIFDDDLSWDVMDALVDGYFALREQQPTKDRPAFMRRFMLNRQSLKGGYFSVITEVSMHIIAGMEQLTDKFPTPFCPDISAGICWANYLRSTNRTPNSVGGIRYQHRYEDGRTEEAWQYPYSIHDEFDRWMRGNWMVDNMPSYFNKKDRQLMSVTNKGIQKRLIVEPIFNQKLLPVFKTQAPQISLF